MRPMRSPIALLVLALVTLPDPAAAQGAKRRARVELGLEAARDLFPVGAGRYLRVHQSEWERADPPGHVTLSVLDVEAGRRVPLELPLAPLYTKHKAKFLDGEAQKTLKNGRRLADFNLELWGYDGKRAVALLHQYRFEAGVQGYAKQRYLLASWDVAGKTVEAVHPVTDLAPGEGVRPFGVTPDGRTFWFVVERRKAGRHCTVQRLDVQSGKVTTVGEVALPAREKYGDLRLFSSRDWGKLALVEYSEKGMTLAPPALGAVVDAQGGKAVTFEAPWTPYGLDFDSTGKRFAVASNQAGTLQLFDAETGKPIGKASGGKFAQALAFSKDDRWIYVISSTLGPKSLDAFAVPSLKKKSIPVGKIVPGARCFDAEGSTFSDDRKWLATWATKDGKPCWKDTSAVDLIDLE